MIFLPKSSSLNFAVCLPLLLCPAFIFLFISRFGHHKYYNINIFLIPIHLISLCSFLCPLIREAVINMRMTNIASYSHFLLCYVVFDLNIVTRIMVLIIFNDQLIRSPIVCCCAYEKSLIKLWVALHGIHPRSDTDNAYVPPFVCT